MLCFLHYSLCVCKNYYKIPFIVKALNIVNFYLNINSYHFDLKENGSYLQSSSKDSLSHRTCRLYCSVYWFESAFQNIPYIQKLAFSSHWKDTIMYSVLKFLNSMAWVLIIYLPNLSMYLYLETYWNILDCVWFL